MNFILSLILLVPLIAAFAVLCGAPARKTSLGAALLNVVLTVVALVTYDPNAEQFQHKFSFDILPELGLRYAVGVDGLSLTMLLLTVIVTAAAIAVTTKTGGRVDIYYSSLLFISAGAIGAFISLDLFFFYSFHELALIPTFLLIGIWGVGNRQSAAWKITLYLAFGSFILLIGLLALYQALPVDQRTFDMEALLARPPVISGEEQHWVFLILLIGFGILISLFPFHTWAPNAYASAPAPAAMLHAGVLKKFGLYGLIRIAVPLLPEGAKHWADLILVLLLFNILYIGLITIAQKRLDLTLGYSSVMHMGYVFLGIASLNQVGVSGAALLMFAHGLSIAAMFALAGEIRERTSTLQYKDLGGLAAKLPFLGLVFGLAAFAAVGLPGFVGFASEIMIFFGAFAVGGEKVGLFSTTQWATILSLWGVVISAVYMLRAYRRIFFGEPSAVSANATAPERSLLRWPIIALVGIMLFFGFFPHVLLEIIAPSLPTQVYPRVPMLNTATAQK